MGEMVLSMDEMMRENDITGAVLVEQLKQHPYKSELQLFLKSKVRSKSVEILTELVWTDYKSNTRSVGRRLEKYDSDTLLRYFLSLYTDHIQTVILEHELDATKCQELKAKGLNK